jgi:hypothetical protein
MMMFFWVLAPCGLVSRCQHFRETVSIFRAEVTMLGIRGINYIGWQEGKSEGMGQSGRSEVEIEPGQ